MEGWRTIYTRENNVSDGELNMASIDRSYNEKRDFIRMRINSPVIICQGGKNYQGVCKDLSGAGMLVETGHAFELGDTLEVSIEQRGENQLPFKASAEVSRLEPTGDKYLVGLAISEILE